MSLQFCFYGDDFTGSTDALETLSQYGIKTMLFLSPPDPEQLARYPGLQAFGVAGVTRSLSPEEIRRVLTPAFRAISKTGIRHVHYKVCSTFDSSPEIGSIGAAADVGAQIFSSRFTSIVVAAPKLGRYSVFGNLFAKGSIGGSHDIYRLDKHPTMSRHPTTPASESDLRVHLSFQTETRSGLVDICQVEAGPSAMIRQIDQELESGCGIVFFDGLYPRHMENIGRVLTPLGTPEAPHFSIGSSGVEDAIGSCWEKTPTSSPPTPSAAASNGPVIIASGSCSPTTAAQIDWALINGFEELAVDTFSLVKEDNYSREAIIREAKAILESGKSLIIHTGKGPDDIRLRQTHDLMSSKGLSKREIQAQTAPLFGGELGKILKQVVATANVTRIGIAGGDTSGIVAGELGIEAFEIKALLSIGAPLCSIYAPGSVLDGKEINFKGGQVGAENYFGLLRDGVSSDQ